MTFQNIQTLEMLEGRMLCAACTFDAHNLAEALDLEKCLNTLEEVYTRDNDCYQNELQKVKDSAEYAKNWVDPCNKDKHLPPLATDKSTNKSGSFDEAKAEAQKRQSKQLQEAHDEHQNLLERHSKILAEEQNLSPLEKAVYDLKKSKYRATL